jgi:hypothetical protein
MNKLQPGDIVVFKTSDNWMSKTIAWLTDSDVSHAAMMLDSERMTEMTASGICVDTVKVLDGDSAILLRLCPTKDSTPLVKAAQKYIDSKTRYDFPALAFLAGLIIYRRIRPTPELVAITDIILRAACVALDKLIQAVILKNPDKAMVCSQLVYQVYEDCGKDYHIEIEGGLLQATRDLDPSDERVCLADLAYDAPKLEMLLSAESAIPNENELAKKLYHALVKEEKERATNFATVNLGDLPSWAKHFLEKLEEFLEKSESNIPINALFISPADLAYKSKNLSTIGKLDIERLK